MKKIITMVLFIIANSLFAIEPVILTEDKGEYPLGLYLEILEDKEGKLTIEDVSSLEYSKKFIQSKDSVPNFGYTDSAYWAHLQVVNSSPKSVEWLLFVNNAYQDDIQIYFQTGTEKFLRKTGGTIYPFSQREIPYRNDVFIVPFQVNQIDIYIRIVSPTHGVQFPLSFLKYQTFLEKMIHEHSGLGVYYGIMAAMFFYNIFLFISIRDRSYLYYIIYILTFTLAQLKINGIAFMYLWPDMPWINQISFNIIIVFFGWSIMQFTQTFLRTKEFTPTLDKIMSKYKIVLFGVPILIRYFVVERIFSQVVLIELFVCIVFIFTAGGIALKRGNRYARYFIAAWFTLLLGLILGILQVFGMIPTSFFTIYGYQIGSALEVIILSLGLADRINLMKKEKEEAQSLAMANQRLAIENLEKTNKTKDEFLANLSHELKTPLSVTYAYSEMLAGGNEYPEKVKKYAVKILDGAKILSNYFNDLLLVTDIESNLQLQKSDVDIASLMDKAVESYKLLLSEKEIELKMNSTEKINIHCDPILLEKAISAVVKNAIVYNKQGGKIEVNIDYPKYPVDDAYMHHSNDKSLQIKITDTGIGIAKEFHEKVFEKFFRVDSSLTYEVSGVGVGLFIAKKIVELHQGSIQITSEINQGTTVTVELPHL